MTSLERDNLVVCYYISSSDIGADKRVGLWWEWLYKRVSFWWEWPYKRSGLWWEWPYKR